MSGGGQLPLHLRIGYAAATGALLLALARLIQQKVSAFGRRSGAAPPAHVLNASEVYIRPVAPREQRSFNREELAMFNGEGGSKIYVSVKNVVFEAAPQLYGSGAPYHVYAGKDISRALAKSRVDDVLCNKDYATEDVTEKELHTLELWFRKFQGKYAVVGWFVPDETYYQLPPDTLEAA